MRFREYPLLNTPNLMAIILREASVGLEDARQDLDEGALPGAVRTEQGVHLARLDDEVGRAEGDHGAEALRDVTGFERGIGHGGRGRVCRGGPQAAPARCSLYGP